MMAMPTDTTATKRRPYRPERPERLDARSRRTGAVLVAVLICLTIITGLFAGALKMALLTTQQIRTEQQLRQTEWLLESGLGRARFRLRADPSYEGEIWQLPREVLGTAAAGQVEIRVSDADEAVRQHRVEVSAEYPTGRPRSVRRTRSYIITMKPQQET